MYFQQFERGYEEYRHMLIHSLQLTNFLSFGATSKPIELRSLNVIIGANGSGKSNFVEGIAFLQSAPTTLPQPIREMGGGTRDWLWKGSDDVPIASVEAIIEQPGDAARLRYRFSFTEIAQRFQLIDELIEDDIVYQDKEPRYHYGYANHQPALRLPDGTYKRLRPEDIDTQLSILAQRRDPDQYPQISYLGDTLAKIRLYREWPFGRFSALRLSQPTDQPNQALMEDGRNLGLLLNRLRRDPIVKKKLLEHLGLIYEGIDDFEVGVEGGRLQLFLQEGKFIVPAVRLSDGTLHYLYLLCILLHPTPPPLICIEEPELGLHPDILPSLADLLIDAATRTQLIVTTHSNILVDAFTETPESVLVCEKHQGTTCLQRLQKDKLAAWLSDYSLGSLWRRGDLGGNRW